MLMQRVDVDRIGVDKRAAQGDGGRVRQRLAADSDLFVHERRYRRPSGTRCVRSAIHLHLASRTLRVVSERLHVVVVVCIRTVA